MVENEKMAEETMRMQKELKDTLLDQIEQAKANGASEEEIDKLMTQWQEQQNEIDQQAKVSTFINFI